ncbi:MAG: GNAT family N-acetyltransferase [Acholeplasmatales bacterium]|nr:GNAT family N-acetyltransferase [Acholeplasmatales bacterium]
MIRRATEKDIKDLIRLLEQVDLVHHLVRPDIFKIGTKYDKYELSLLIRDNSRPIFVYDDSGVKGYAFTIFKKHINDPILTDIKTLYIDDLCVDKEYRGHHIGEELYKYVLDYAKKNNCYNVTLNVWYDNKPALAFYEKMGLSPLKICLEQKL